MSRYTKGYKIAIKAEERERYLNLLDAKWKNFQAEFLHVKAGPSLEDDLLRMKRKVFGECLVSQDNQVINIDVTQPRPYSKIDSEKFKFDDTVSVNVKGVLFTFKWLKQEDKVSVMRYENAYDAKTMDVKELQALPKFLHKFALCVIKDRFIILSGGVDAYDLVCS